MMITEVMMTRKNRKKEKVMSNQSLVSASSIVNKPNDLITRKDMDEIKAYCTATTASFDKLGIAHKGNVFIPGIPDTDNKPRVLAVGHLDCYSGAYFDLGTSIFAPMLDDRLGVWSICRKLPTLVGGRHYDILLTTGEESGKSTASEFADQTDAYNWIFELDRHGCDAVHYGFTDLEWIDALEHDGWDMNAGSFSDISEFEDGVVCAVNFGVGYQNEHTVECHVKVGQLANQLSRVASFYRMYKDRKFVHNPSPPKGKSSKYDARWYLEHDYDWDDTAWNVTGKSDKTLPNWSQINNKGGR